MFSLCSRGGEKIECAVSGPHFSKTNASYVIAGDIGDDIDTLYDMGVSFVLSTNRVAKSFSETKHRTKSDLELTFETLARIIKTIEKAKN